MSTARVAGAIIGGKYRLGRLLGKGGMGEVYEAHHEATGRRVALKLMLEMPHEHESIAERQARFSREFRIVGQIQSEHVVQVLDAAVSEDFGQYMVLEYLDGEDLGTIVDRLGPLPEDTVLRIGVQAARGLSAAHDLGVTHRDIKPANLFLCNLVGDARIVKVVDFGIARAGARVGSVDLTQDLTTTGGMIGSPSYMSPEQIRGMPVDARADVWSLCATLYRLLSGHTPHQQTRAGVGDLVLRICSAAAKPVHERAPWVSPATSAIVARGLTIRRGERYATARDLERALLERLGEMTGSREPLALSAGGFRPLEGEARHALDRDPEYLSGPPPSAPPESIAPLSDTIAARDLATGEDLAPLSHTIGARDVAATTTGTPPMMMTRARSSLVTRSALFAAVVGLMGGAGVALQQTPGTNDATPQFSRGVALGAEGPAPTEPRTADPPASTPPRPPTRTLIPAASVAAKPSANPPQGAGVPSSMLTDFGAPGGSAH